MADDLDDIRYQLALLARRPRARITKWTRERPTQWQPQRVLNPETGMVFTTNSAFELIARLLEDGAPLEEVELRTPPGKRAYVLRHELDRKQPPLYIKLELGSGTIIGRSFHLSERQEASKEKHRDE